MKTILVTGGTGLIGKALAKALKAQGYSLILLSRSRELPSHYDKVFQWDATNRRFDYAALDGVTDIIHLAGAGIADKRWTEQRKKEIVESRVAPLQAIRTALAERGQKINTLVSGSAVGWYGSISDSLLHTENEPAAGDFMGETCRLWENAANAFSDCAHRVVTIRNGIVLDAESGAFPSLLRAVKLGFGAPLGTGCQQMPWIHRDDSVAVFKSALENTAYSGPINATASENCNNRTFTKVLCQEAHRPFWPIPVPPLFLRVLFGEMADVVLHGSRISNQKLKSLGFTFRHSDLSEAIRELLKTQTPESRSSTGVVYPVKPTNRG